MKKIARFFAVCAILSATFSLAIPASAGQPTRLDEIINSGKAEAEKWQKMLDYLNELSQKAHAACMVLKSDEYMCIPLLEKISLHPDVIAAFERLQENGMEVWITYGNGWIFVEKNELKISYSADMYQLREFLDLTPYWWPYWQEK